MMHNGHTKRTKKRNTPKEAFVTVEWLVYSSCTNCFGTYHPTKRHVSSDPSGNNTFAVSASQKSSRLSPMTFVHGG